MTSRFSTDNKKVARTIRLTERQWGLLNQLGWGHVTVGLVRALEETIKREGLEAEPVAAAVQRDETVKLVPKKGPEVFG